MLKHLTVKDIPGRYKDLVDNIGIEGFRYLVQMYGGTLFYVPTIEMVNKYLVKSFEGNVEARDLMHEAQCLAGMAFTNALLGIVHSMAHKVGAVFHIPHGCANAIFLPYVIQYNRINCEDRYADIARMLKLEGDTDSELTDSLISKINELNDLSILDHYNYYINLGMQNNDAIKQVAKDMGVAKNIIYNHIVEVKKINKVHSQL